MNTENTNDQVVQLYLDDIIPNRFQPREVFDEKALKELAVSIKEHGVIQPIIVRNVKGKYEIIAGERRYKASALAGLTKIPAIIRDLDDKESSKVALLENLQRKNLTPIEEARTYQKILEIDEMTQEELAKTMGKSQSAVANKLRLLSLPDEVQDSLLKEQISERHARALLNIPEPNKQTEMLKKIINNKMSVRAVEEEIKQMYPKEENNEGVGNMDNQNIGMPRNIDIPTTNSYINTSPLLPTTDIPSSPVTAIPEISSLPPIGPELPGFIPPVQNTLPQQETAKFINYGEIDDEDDVDSEPPMQFNNPITSVDINSIRNNAVDIGRPNEEKSMPSADLDSLLNLQNISAGPAAGTLPGTSKFLSPAEEIVKTDSTKPLPKETVADYFKTADFVPNMSNLAAGNLGTSEISSPANYNVETAMQKLRETISELKSHGIAIHADEMNFANSYQIIIKLDK